jgi:dipeptidyl-peptidase-3
MCAVQGVYEEWRKIVICKPRRRWKLVQADTFHKDEKVEVKVYEQINEGIIRSWVERDV